MADILDRMKAVCERYGAAFVDTPGDAIVGVAGGVTAGCYPVHGLRHRQGETSGWFIWAGEELSADPDFFKPTHARHLMDRCPDVQPMLGLGEGWRFLIAPDHQYVWFDPALLEHIV